MRAKLARGYKLEGGGEVQEAKAGTSTEAEAGISSEDGGCSLGKDSQLSTSDTCRGRRLELQRSERRFGLQIAHGKGGGGGGERFL
jgi:hypothetical protein